MENETDDIEIYVVERRLFRSSRENEIVVAFREYNDAIRVRDALPAPGGKITTVRLDQIASNSDEEDLSR